MFKRRKKEFDIYEEDTMNLASKEEEIMESYLDEALLDTKETDYVEESYEEEDETVEFQDNISETTKEDNTTEEYEDYDDYDEEDNYSNRSEKNYKRIINIIFTLIIIILTVIAVDVISVARYNVGPFFAIPLEKYKDGGSKAYYGLGYKVIKYNQIQGRRDIEIGFWTLKYSSDPYTVQDLDLAIEFTEKGMDAYKKYYKKFVRITSTLENIDTTKNKIKLTYHDEGGKYTLNIECSMATKKTELEKLEPGKEITIIGTVTNFNYKSKNSPNKLYVSNCFAEQ